MDTSPAPGPLEALAAALCRIMPHWLVLWGLHSRRFWGFAGFGPPPGTVVSVQVR